MTDIYAPYKGARKLINCFVCKEPIVNGEGSYDHFDDSDLKGEYVVHEDICKDDFLEQYFEGMQELDTYE